jgi:sulfatase maturation enzyme AslB (radical SAM superfamily)
MPSLEITTVVGCKLACTYCPQSKLSRAYARDLGRMMSFEDFRTIISTVPRHVRIDFSGMSEPWMNQEATDMLQYTLAAGFNIAVYTTLVGMTEEQAEDVIDTLSAYSSQVEVLCIHLPDANGNMRGFHEPPPGYLDNLRRFVELGSSGVLRDFELMTMDKDGLTHPSVAGIVASVPSWIGLTRAGNVNEKTIRGELTIEATPRHETAVGCSYTPFYDQNVVMPNGDVLLCCMDYEARHVIGNLLRDTYYSLFDSPKMNRLRLHNMQLGYCAESLCKSCSRAAPFISDPLNKHRWTTPQDYEDAAIQDL